MTLAARNLIVGYASGLGAKINVVTITILLAVATASTASIARTAFTDVFKASHIVIIEPIIRLLTALVSDFRAPIDGKKRITLAKANVALFLADIFRKRQHAGVVTVVESFVAVRSKAGVGAGCTLPAKIARPAIVIIVARFSPPTEMFLAISIGVVITDFTLAGTVVAATIAVPSRIPAFFVCIFIGPGIAIVTLVIANAIPELVAYLLAALGPGARLGALYIR